MLSLLFVIMNVSTVFNDLSAFVNISLSIVRSVFCFLAYCKFDEILLYVPKTL